MSHTSLGHVAHTNESCHTQNTTESTHESTSHATHNNESYYRHVCRKLTSGRGGSEPPPPPNSEGGKFCTKNRARGPPPPFTSRHRNGTRPHPTLALCTPRPPPSSPPSYFHIPQPQISIRASRYERSRVGAPPPYWWEKTTSEP